VDGLLQCHVDGFLQDPAPAADHALLCSTKNNTTNTLSREGALRSLMRHRQVATPRGERRER
jgi:hypothetical protein